MKDFETIIYEVEEKVAWITLNRPKALNAQNNLMRKELILALDDARTDRKVVVIVITASGEKAFCVGLDVTEVPVVNSADLLQLRGPRTVDELIREVCKPVIAAVNGYALGGGCELAMACDIIIASENAKFGQPEIKMGIIPGSGGSQMLPRLIGEKKAKELIFTGRSITADEALALGLINRVVPQANLRAAVEELSKDIAKNSPLTLGFAKLAVNKSMENHLSSGLICEKDISIACFGTEDQKEAVKAFLEKREPVFKGK